MTSTGPKGFFDSSYPSYFASHNLSIVLDLSLDDFCAAVDTDAPGGPANLAWHEATHFWQVAATHYGLLMSQCEFMRQQLVHLSIAEQAESGTIHLPVAPSPQSDRFRSIYTEMVSPAVEESVRLDGYEVVTVSSMSESVVSTEVRDAGLRQPLPCLLVPLVDSPELARIPIGARAVMEGAAEIVGRSCLRQEDLPARAQALRPVQTENMRAQPTLWHYSACEVLFKTLFAAERHWSDREADRLLLDILDFAMLVPWLGGNPHESSPGHRFLHLARTAAAHAPRRFPGATYRDLFERLVTASGYPSAEETTGEILSGKMHRLAEHTTGPATPFPLLLPQLYRNFKEAAHIRKARPFAFGSDLLDYPWRRALFAALPPPLVHLRDQLWIAPWPPDDSGMNENVHVTYFLLSSILEQARVAKRIVCPFKTVGARYPCGCDFEHLQAEPSVPTHVDKDIRCAFLSVWKQLGGITGKLGELPVDF